MCSYIVVLTIFLLVKYKFLKIKKFITETKALVEDRAAAAMHRVHRFGIPIIGTPTVTTTTPQICRISRC
jgi:hypothetical protein